MICVNGFCPSGIETPKKCPALGFCDRGIPARTVHEKLKDTETLVDLLYDISIYHDELPWDKWACNRCASYEQRPCDIEDECCYKGKERELIKAWLQAPERVWNGG